MDFKNKKFVASYSGGKDSILAIYRAIRLGMKPVSLIITYNTDLNRSWFHGIPEDLVNEVSKALDIPIKLIKTSGAEYAKNFEKELLKQKENGVDICIFGDIDIEDHFKWCTDRCNAVGLEAFFPLWGEKRIDLVNEVIESGFKANITVVDCDRLSEKHLGMVLSPDAIQSIISEGADACGENGEYHTFVSDGPLFKHPVSFQLDEKVCQNNYAVLPITLDKDTTKTLVKH